MNTVLHTNGTPGFTHASGSNVDRVMEALKDRHFCAKSMSIHAGTNKGKDAVPNGEGRELTIVPVLCVCPEGSKNAFKATLVRPAGPMSYIGLQVGQRNTQGFQDPWKAIEAGNAYLRSQKERKFASMTTGQRDALSSVADLKIALLKLESALGKDDDLCTPIREKIALAIKSVGSMSV